MTIEELVQQCQQNNTNISESQQNQLLSYAHLLKEWNQKMNLTAIDDVAEVIEKHFHDCLLGMWDADVQGDVLDVGSGAGFPGVVWAIVKPDLKVTLLEPTGKRVRFLETVKEELGLDNVEIINARAEEYVVQARETYDVVTARAVANLPILAELCIPFVKKDGYFVALKGAKGEEENDASSNAIRILGCTLSSIHKHTSTSGDRVNLVYQKVKDTPLKYPRNYSQIRKKPL